MIESMDYLCMAYYINQFLFYDIYGAVHNNFL